ncbi:hypothetical protein QBC35DRAFT_506723 [Podospora australis]|uniref:Protein HRI1 n=1 Tax=Podospora australis TaxID=1536484 RepID=A0AAN6WL72_9PEZI|nr:hypothetical protein QBC35DRAFT_506723 [Podospora australis]
MADISIREYIRWLPDGASEPTSTIVLTSPKRRFVDVRILKPTLGEKDAGVHLPLSRLDWAIAGTSSSEPRFDDSQKAHYSHCQWRHWINSRTVDTEGAADEGDNFAVTGDTALTLEKGRMVNPTTGIETDYEEMWRTGKIEGPPQDGGLVCLVVRWEGAEDDGIVRRGLVVRVGQHCQAFAREGDDISVERLQWEKSEERWVITARIGSKELLTDFVTMVGVQAEVDDEVVVRGDRWVVVEKVTN